MRKSNKNKDLGQESHFATQSFDLAKWQSDFKALRRDERAT